MPNSRSTLTVGIHTTLNVSVVYGIIFFGKATPSKARLKYPGRIGCLLFSTTPGGIFSTGNTRNPHTWGHTQTHKWKISTNKRSWRRGREGRKRGTRIGLLSPRWCWVLRHGDEKSPNPIHEPLTAVQAVVGCVAVIFADSFLYPSGVASVGFRAKTLSIAKLF